MLKLNSFTLSDSTKVHLSVLNTRTISMYPVNDKYEIKDKDGKIISISYNNGEYAISKGEAITIGKNKYKINEIERNSTSLSDKNTYNLFTFRKVTTTSNFIMPFLGGNRANWRWSTYFINAFIDEKDPTIVKLLYRFSGSTEFTEFEKLIQSFPHFVDSVDLDPFNSIYSFKIPEEFEEDTKLIMNSKYSQVSEKAKFRIMEFAASNKKLPLGQILYKCPIRRQEMSKEIDFEIPIENELYDLFKIEEETFLDSYILNENDKKRRRIVPPSGFV